MRNHKQTVSRLALAILACCWSSSLLHCQETATFLLPIRPAELLKFLPEPQTGWRLTASNAKHVVRNRPLSKASRELVRDPSPGDPSPTEAKQSLARITLLDMAGNTELAALFSGEAAPGDKGGRLTVNGMPGIRRPTPEESDHLEVLAYNRFIITVVLIGPDPAKAEDWLKRINLEGLRQAAAKETRYDPRKDLEFLVDRVDELDPKRTRSARFSIAPEDEPN